MRWHYTISFFTNLIGLGFVFAQAGPFPQAHSHNDYEHRRPLFEALEHGFLSVEADVHLTTDGRLLVGHEAVNRHSPSLEHLYVQPLDSLLQVNDGWVNARRQIPFNLMIDLKTEGRSTTAKLLQLLQRYPRLLTAGGPILIILSGNVPKKELLAAPFEGLLIDGRPSDLSGGVVPERMPWISDRFSNWGVERNGKVTPESLNKIRELARRVHKEGKKLRLWAIPDQSQAWAQLLEAGVDLINTDDLPGLSTFLSGITRR